MATVSKYFILFAGLIMLSTFAVSVLAEAVPAEQIEKIEKIELEHEEKIRVIVKLKDTDVEQFMISSTPNLDIRYRYNYFNGFAAKVSEEELKALRNNPNVEAVYVDELFRVALDASAQQVNATPVWNLQFNSENITGKGQTVCVVDTGVNYTHSALGGCTNDTFLAGSCSKVVGGYDLFNDDSDPVDDEGHGSHVTGIVSSNDSTYRGIAYDSKIFAVKVLDSTGSGYASDVAKGIDMCRGNASVYNISAITMSFVAVESNGTEKKYPSICDNETGSYGLVVRAANNASANGIFVAAAAGNWGYSDGIGLPACGSNVTSVSSVNSDDSDSGYNIGSLLDLFAPGTAIMSVDYRGGFVDDSGTSMAAPHAAGAALLLQQYEKLESNSSIAPKNLTDIFKSTGKNITSRGYTIPRIDIKAAIQAIDDTPPANASDLNNVGAGFSNITINWTNPLDTDFNHVEVWANGVFKGNVSKPNDVYTITGLLANTTYEIQIKTVDDSLNINDTFVGMNITTLADTEAPRIYLISPQNNSNISQGTVIDLEAYDNGEISSLWYSKNNGTNQTSASPYDIDTSTWTSGAVYLKVWANDTGNNVNATGFFFNVNSSAPVVTNVNILPADADNSDDLTCNYTYYDADNNTESNDTIIKWYTDGNESTGFENLTLVSQTNTTRGQRWNCSVTPHDGIVYGATVMSGEVTIQNAAPAVTITYPNGGETLANVTMATWTASDYENDSLGYFAYYRMNSSSSWTAITGCSNITVTNCTWNTSLVSNGASYRLGANATDIFGASSFDMSNTDFAINNTVTNETGGSGNGGDGGETQTTTTTELLAAGGGPAPQPEGGTAAVEAAEVTTNETTTETPAITGAASLVDLLKGNAGTALVIGVITALIVLALVLFTKRGKGKVGKYKSI